MTNTYSQLSRLAVESRLSDMSSSSDTSDDESGGEDYPEDSPYNSAKVSLTNPSHEQSIAEEFRNWVNLISDKNNDMVKYLQMTNIVPKPTTAQATDNGKNGLVVEIVTVGDHVNVRREVFYQSGVRHGYYREFIDQFNDKLGCGVWAVGRFDNGRKSGIHWKRNLGNSFNVGQLDDNNESEGTGNFFLYPDLLTVIRGEYEQGRLAKGRQVRLTGYNKEYGIPVPTAEGGNQAKTRLIGEVVQYSPSTATTISRTPLLRDPYETRYVYVGPSGIPMSGEGLYAKETIRAGGLCAAFNGVRVYNKEESSSEYRIHHEGGDLDINKEDESVSRYCATLGHKVCHSFRPNAQFEDMDHPVYGHIKSIVAIRNIRAGEEILVSYNYNVQTAPAWYQQLYLTHCRNHMNWSEKELNSAREFVYGRQQSRVPKRFARRNRKE